MQRSAERSPAIPGRRLLGRVLLALVSTDATGVAVLFVAAAVEAVGRHPHDAVGLLLVALVGLAGVLLALVAIPVAVRSFDDAQRAIATTRRATVLIRIGLVINTLGTVAILGAGPAAVGPTTVLLLVAGDVLSILYLVLLRSAARAAAAVR